MLEDEYNHFPSLAGDDTGTTVEPLLVVRKRQGNNCLRVFITILFLAVSGFASVWGLFRHRHVHPKVSGHLKFLADAINETPVDVSQTSQSISMEDQSGSTADDTSSPVDRNTQSISAVDEQTRALST